MTHKVSERAILLLLLSPVLALNVWCGARIFQIVEQQSTIKEDYAEVNSIRNGLLSVEVWKAHLKKIAAEKLSNYQLSPEQEEAVRGAVEKAINALILETDKMIRKPQKTLKGKARKLAFKIFVDTEALTEQTPQYAQAVLEEVKKPANLKKLKNMALSQIQVAKQDADENRSSTMKTLLTKYDATSVEGFNERVGTLIREEQKEVQTYALIMIGSLFLFLLVWWGIRRKSELYKTHYTLSVALAFILLLSALTLPMIDIDARIKNIDFLLMGEHLQFTNQLLFYRSKSIMQMVKVLVVAGSPQTVFVGFLILLFSIIFPITKLVSTLVCLFGGQKLRTHKLVHFFAFQSGKWSMADVMVVAIFMAYIGFNGVLNGQLKGLNFKSQTIGIIATNETALQSGFTLFLAFVLFGLILSTILKWIVPQDVSSD